MLTPNSVNVSLHMGHFILSVFNILMSSIFPHNKLKNALSVYEFCLLKCENVCSYCNYICYSHC
jgi:hypothetical protein